MEKVFLVVGGQQKRTSFFEFLTTNAENRFSLASTIYACRSDSMHALVDIVLCIPMAKVIASVALRYLLQ